MFRRWLLFRSDNHLEVRVHVRFDTADLSIARNITETNSGLRVKVYHDFSKSKTHFHPPQKKKQTRWKQNQIKGIRLDTLAAATV